MTKLNFEKVLLEAIDYSLASLGDSSKQAIYFHLEKGFSIRKQEIPRNIQAFSLAVEKIFGLGANFLESLILKRLIERTNLAEKEKPFVGLDFVQTVGAIKLMMEQ